MLTDNAVTLLAFDFDGALASSADRTRLDPAAAEFLTRAAEIPGVVLAVASDRDADDLASRLGTIAAYLIASDGMEIRGPHGSTLVGAPALKIELDRVIRRNADLCGFRTEERQDGVALCWSGVPYLHDRHPVVDCFREWAKANDLELIEGADMVRARRRSSGKEAALRWVSSAAAAGRVIFAGDDTSDAGALRFAAHKGRAFLITPANGTAPDGVTVVNTCEHLLRLLGEEIVVRTKR